LLLDKSLWSSKVLEGYKVFKDRHRYGSVTTSQPIPRIHSGSTLHKEIMVFIDNGRLTDEIMIELDRMRVFEDRIGLVGYGIAALYGATGQLKQLEVFSNLITTAGDQYYAKMGIVGVSPAAPTAPTLANGMKLGTGSTAVAKSGAGGALVTYKTGSNVVFNASYPVAAAVAGTDTGWTATYQSTWAAGVATDAALTEVVIVNDQATNATTTAANTYSRALFASAINKGALDALTVTWAHKFLGS
jgi:hypothetical protein